MIDEMALRVCPNTQISMERKAPTMPAAASDSIPLMGIFPTIAVSVIDSNGSAIPETVAGMARRLIFLKVTAVFDIIKTKAQVHSSGRDVRSV